MHEPSNLDQLAGCVLGQTMNRVMFVSVQSRSTAGSLISFVGVSVCISMERVVYTNVDFSNKPTVGKWRVATMMAGATTCFLSPQLLP